MHILKFDKSYTRRHFLESAGKSLLGAGMLAPLWDVIARDGDVGAAYTEEALSIEHYSNGAVKPGGVIDASNAAAVKDLLDPVAYIEVTQQGRVIDIKAPETDIMRLSPVPYMEATLRHRGLGMLDAVGNIKTKDGKPWPGGIPFTDGASAQELVANQSLSWGRHDVSFFNVQEEDLNADDKVLFNYRYLFIEFIATGRTVLDPKPYFPGHEDKLKFSTFLLTAPQGPKGTSVLNIWYNDQLKLPEFYGYLPDFKRIRRFTPAQRFEPNIPGSNFFPSDTFMVGDPYLTWGNFKLVGKVPFLAALSGNWWGHKDNWVMDRVGGKSGQRFHQTTMELVPEAYVVDLEPTGYPTSPYSKRRIWIDARTLYPMAMLMFDRHGKMLKQYEHGTGMYQLADGTQWPETGTPYWSWSFSNTHNIQIDSISTSHQVHEIDGGYTTRVDDPAVYEQFCTIPAVRRLGK